ncbi:MAG TPA: hypothetical protein VM889_05990 [Candidatus Thermoplasmatota archaeon]|nr:hypothetical protein [Candidatus Thermoplasmatota archaeon]
MLSRRRSGRAAIALGVIGLALLAPLVVHAIQSSLAGAGRLATWQVVASALGAVLGILGGATLPRTARGAILVAAGGVIPILFLAPLVASSFASLGSWESLAFVAVHFWAFGLLYVGVSAARGLRLEAREKPLHWHSP